ncbi:tetratricopeptide repeat protein [Halotalea alkalilenta]|uniref:Type III secretion protein n=1 Tax=Halotalea alkalilenta TaxID=376489 RepID=A0A172YHV4_9GAMM|nr:tetratricopeptide repeat protein [Halotalea alkalilenta]ANF58736.1 hypothetical protein A5892_15715 [Halotalea alkalilenta]
MNAPDQDACELLHRLGHLHLKGGNPQRALVLLLLASKMFPEHPGLLHTLIDAFIATGQTQRALNAIDALARTQIAPAHLELLRSKALWADGDITSARGHFNRYLDQRGES